ncbi:hypothetical protein O3P69_001397 [Scylla paramamosain]|uniref:Uncharacterized protein n=1 Tax=Scylla paramamosain TaxID=85552 RepID=A0AAW0URE0_SCYPA
MVEEEEEEEEDHKVDMKCTTSPSLPSCGERPATFKRRLKANVAVEILVFHGELRSRRRGVTGRVGDDVQGEKSFRRLRTKILQVLYRPLILSVAFFLALKSSPASLKAPRLAESPCFITPGQARPLPPLRDPKHDPRIPHGRRLTSGVTSLSQDVGPA